MMRVEHTWAQKATALGWFGGWVVLSGVAIVDKAHNGTSALSFLPLLLGVTSVLALFGYLCWFTLTYKFQEDEEGFSRTVGFTRIATRWDEVASWSIVTRSKAITFNQEPILRTIRGEEVGLDARVWYSSTTMAQARKEFLALVQTKLADKQEPRV